MTNRDHPGVNSPGVDSPGVLGRILGWLEAGYPDGVPRPDRFALVALLKRRLTDDEVREIAHRLTSDLSRDDAITDPITSDEIELLIAHALADTPSSADIGRVSARLAAGGWPLAGDEDDESDATPANRADRNARTARTEKLQGRAS